VVAVILSPATLDAISLWLEIAVGLGLGMIMMIVIVLVAQQWRK
jgi:hypothetical protein